VKHAHPFIKWVGGKTQLLPKLLGLIPKEIKTYYEPFLGGGAVFWALAKEGRFEQAILNDWNEELTNTYKVVRDKPESLIEQLTIFADEYKANPEETFSTIRAYDREDITKYNPVVRAARMIFLNKTCYNGLYRVNKAGQFNSPFGEFKTPPTVCDAQNIRDCSAVLEKVPTIHTGDFALIAEMATEGDVVYFDPPYEPVSDTADFTSYTEVGFGREDQLRLASLFKKLAERGVRVLMSNHDTPSIREMYAGFEVIQVPARRNINSKGSKRGHVMEVVVVSHPVPKDTSLFDLAMSGELDDAAP
jgi:DNA adenine methylase